MKQQESYTKLQRYLARAALVLIALLLLLVLWLLITGASPETLLGALFCLIVLPCFVYALNLYLRHTTGRRTQQTPEQEESSAPKN